MIASYSTIDSESIVDFLKQIRNHAKFKGKINLILDRARYHCANIVKNTALIIVLNWFIYFLISRQRLYNIKRTQ